MSDRGYHWASRKMAFLKFSRLGMRLTGTSCFLKTRTGLPKSGLVLQIALGKMGRNSSLNRSCHLFVSVPKLIRVFLSFFKINSWFFDVPMLQYRCYNRQKCKTIMNGMITLMDSKKSKSPYKKGIYFRCVLLCCCLMKYVYLQNFCYFH